MLIPLFSHYINVMESTLPLMLGGLILERGLIIERGFILEKIQ